MVIEVNVDGEIKAFNIVEPDFQVKAKAINAIIGGSLVDAGKIILDACYTGEYDELHNNDDVYLSACLKCAEFVKIYESELKKN